MKEYNPKNPKEYHLENSLYLRVLHTIRDYPRMVERINDVLYGSSSVFEDYTDSSGKKHRTVLPHSNEVGNPTEQKAFAIEEYQNTLDGIDKALKKIPTEYRQHIFDNIVYRANYPLDYADKMTWSRWRTRFIYFVAENLKLL